MKACIFNIRKLEHLKLSYWNSAWNYLLVSWESNLHSHLQASRTCQCGVPPNVYPKHCGFVSSTLLSDHFWTKSGNSEVIFWESYLTRASFDTPLLKCGRCRHIITLCPEHYVHFWLSFYQKAVDKLEKRTKTLIEVAQIESNYL